ncbi:hypothetical protein [Actinoplanes sp. NPDC049681]|uniref:hypothetical protein n=1 Tax=Actinoplanes sp. NPDC049681 TaxID=3363905 RepID=UPI003790BDA8
MVDQVTYLDPAFAVFRRRVVELVPQAVGPSGGGPLGGGPLVTAASAPRVAQPTPASHPSWSPA